MKPSDDNTSASRPSDAESIEATAAAWLAQRDDGLSADDERRFREWRAADRRHSDAVARLEHVWTSLQELRDFRPMAQRHPDRDLLHRRAPRMMPALAAIALICVVILGWWVHTQRSDARGQTYATTTGGYQRVALADGSVTELNAATELNVMFTPTERRVRLSRGEAHFTVAKDAARPFAVEAGGVTVRALGTAFNLRVAGPQVEVLVTEGRVSVAGSAAQTAEVAANERVVMPAASAPAPSASVPLVERMDAAAVREALAWQGLRIVFRDTPLAEAILQFNLRNVVQIELGDAEIGRLPIGGSFRVENVEGFVRLLESGGEIAVSRPDDERIVLRKAK